MGELIITISQRFSFHTYAVMTTDPMKMLIKYVEIELAYRSITYQQMVENRISGIERKFRIQRLDFKTISTAVASLYTVNVRIPPGMISFSGDTVVLRKRKSTD